jgi:succinate dehydrogenase / fumarate reductase membrane anchor subunit
MLLLLIASVTIHLRFGVQVVIVDYVHNEGLKLGLLAANTFFAVVIAVASGIAILKLALGG